MKVIDQNSALSSLERNLVPGRSLIDGRSERDRLHFLSEFASLINFYDENNTLSGSWTPFLLKDPVFLLASISRIRFEKWNARYKQACLKVEKEEPLTVNSTDLGPSFNQLFDQFMEVFTRMERWTYYMQKMDDVYDLKNYVLNKVEDVFAPYFWALRSFREALSASGNIPGIMPPEPLYFTDAFKDRLWTENKDKEPYWQVLGLESVIPDIILEEPASAGTSSVDTPVPVTIPPVDPAGDYFHGLKTTGDELFVFFHTVIQHAAPEYEKLKAQQSNYPDTTLLRTFVELLKVQQDQLNELSGKHLEFYYRDILKQSKLFAVPDDVIICAETAKKDVAFHLPAGTEFDAGLDAEKNPITYASVEEVTLNPAAISNAYTLSCLREDPLSMLSSLYFQAIKNPGTLEKSEDGTIKKWETFGGATPVPASQISLGIAFASPMLLLREGQRNITLTFTFEEAIDPALMQNATYFLSTAAAWLAVKPMPDISQVVVANQSVVQIELDPSQPPIEKFLTDPNGLNSEWPMLKIEFSSFINMSSPPVITDLRIDVNVSGVKNLQLYNDNGLLSTKTPFQLFGPVPLLNNSFIIGSNEIFSKPLNQLIIEMNWDTLPSDFAVYYAQYNEYLLDIFRHITPFSPPPPSIPWMKEEPSSKPWTKLQPVHQPTTLPPPPPVKPPFWKRLMTGIGKILLVYWIWKAFHKNSEDELKEKSGVIPVPPVPELPPLFSNVCFTVDFQLLKEQSWKKMPMYKVEKAADDSYKKYETNRDCSPQPKKEENLLFSMDNKCRLTDKSYFRYNRPVEETPPPVHKKPFVEDADPYIQNTPLVFTDTTASGFMRMTLDDPSFGFGAEMYPILVSDIALQNAALLVDMNKKEGRRRRRNATEDEPPKFIAPAVMPFVPKLTGFTANYSATCTYDLTNEKGEYPLQCFFYSPFENYSVYDNSPAAVENNTSAGLTITGVVWARSGLPLFPQLKYKGVLFLEIENLVPADSLNIFFKLSRKYDSSPGSRDIEYNYLSTTGWKKLQVLANDTNNFTCSGVIKVNVPLDMATDSLVLPEKKYWISIGVKKDPGNFAETVYLKTNGFDVRRSGTAFLAVTEKPSIPANTIQKTKMPVPEISTIVQPFPSQGGRAAETQTAMNRRVSNRLKTKDRAVTTEDYFRLIRQEYDDIYYSKVIFNNVQKSTEIYVVKAYDRATDPNAFLPLVSECMEGKIEQFLKDRASVFARINVSNFKIEYVKVKAVVFMKSGYENEGVRKACIDAINIFLSPWIASSQKQVAIDQGISDAELAACLKNIEGVSSVESVSFQTCLFYTPEGPIENEQHGQQGKVITPLIPSALFVPYLTHDIQCKK